MLSNSHILSSISEISKNKIPYFKIITFIEKGSANRIYKIETFMLNKLHSLYQNVNLDDAFY